MRILHVGKYFPPEPGGIERFLDDLSREQAHQGIEVAVLAHDRRHAGVERRDGRCIHRCRSYGQLLFTPLAPSWPWRLAQVVAEHQPDLLHLHLPNPAAFAALLLPAARRRPWVLHWHADVPLDAEHGALRLAYPPYAAFERRLLARSAAVIATSRAYLDASHALAAFRERCQVVPLGMGEAPVAASAPDWPDAGLRVLAVGRLSYYKGFDRLIDAVARTEGISLLLVGQGDQASRLRSQISTLGLGGRVRMLAGLDDAEVEACYQAAEVVCLPSIDRAEAFGLVLVEAMRAGRAVIASDLPGSGMREVVVEGETGLKVTPGSVDELAAALSRLRDDPPLRARLGTAAAERFARHYRLQPVAEAIASLYRRVLDAERPPD